MWFLIPIILLLTHAAVGSPETDSIREPASSAEENYGNGAVEKMMSKSNIQESMIWNGGELPAFKKYPNTIELGKTDWIEISKSIEEANLPINANGVRKKRSIDELESDMKIMLKRSESVPIGSWLYMPKERNSLASDEGQDLSQEKKSPSFNPWGGKRITLLRSSPKIRRPIRVPFNSWGGKRGEEEASGPADSVVYSKRGRLLYEPNDRSAARLDGLGIKRLAADGGKNGRRVPFNSWGGKRSSYEDFDLERGSESAMGDGRLGSVKG